MTLIMKSTDLLSFQWPKSLFFYNYLDHRFFDPSWITRLLLIADNFSGCEAVKNNYAAPNH